MAGICIQQRLIGGPRKNCLSAGLSKAAIRRFSDLF